MKVKEIMHSGADWSSPDTTVAELAKIMRDRDIGAIPIGENDRLVGMVTDRDIVCRAVADERKPSTATARDVMSPGIVYCKADDDVGEAIRRMEEKQVRRVPVIDENKRMIGILSLGDIAHAAPAELTSEFAAAVSAHH